MKVLIPETTQTLSVIPSYLLALLHKSKCAYFVALSAVYTGDETKRKNEKHDSYTCDLCVQCNKTEKSMSRFTCLWDASHFNDGEKVTR